MKTLTQPALLKDKCYINGEWHSAASGKTEDIMNPATGEVITAVPFMDDTEALKAIEHAAAAQIGWRSELAKTRSAILRRWFELVMANQDDLALILSSEQGKPFGEAKGEIAYAASFIEWFGEEGKRIYGDIIPENIPGTRMTVRKEPIGVTVAITPWNFPAAMITRKAGPALAAGCTMIIKPAPQTPLTAFALVALAEEAGVPAGVLQVITGDSIAIGEVFCESKTVRKLSFTGSTGVGKILMRQSADNIKKLSLELGGNAPFIVFDDANVNAAVAGAVVAKFRNNGQTCVCPNRFYVQSGIHDEFVEKLAAEVDKLKIGNGMEEGVDLGPLIDEKAHESVLKLILDAKEKGAVQATKRDLVTNKRAPFISPVVLTNADDSMQLCSKEIFGPVAPVYKFETIDEAIAVSNDTDAGLAAYLYTQSINTYTKVSEGLEYGIVAVNTGAFSTEVAPFGGVKESGLGREGSMYGIEDYLEIKYVCLGGLS
ncbi:NAD-dependent succinate-semialdehyde dehydrogenase [Leucothrix arctica]|uniref:Succinate-semialdehyde dehydrogenase (NADP(+)) n=1 Tax=Leucothrix arctica TaxID=1481894 RepID=A0A317C9J1_9GAMM|nr:NAD-dependent succinate-semialdehyde dehydrogenase [Leucothrix arctica]PWQ95274.1 succinate-semialdehyde dehydrogenase (NADP(+)) [Leucothrix arctica]